MGGKRFRLKPCALVAASISLAFAHASLWANPTGPQVVSGQVSFQKPNASVLNVTNSPGSIINWQGFSIGAGEVTRFVQQSAASSVLNRVTGGNVSQIYGQLLSNGRVFLINPGGIVVGPGAIVDTAGFVASTLNMLDSDYLAGRLKFQGDSTSGSIVNEGWIRTGYGGHVLLVAPTIENSGLVHTPGGDLILAAGQKVTLSTLDLAGVQMEVQAPTDSVINVGKLLADGGAVGVFAGTLRHTGEIRANALVYDEAGRIVLKGQNEVQLAAGSVTSADGKSGGSITVQSDGSTRVAGHVSAAGSAGQGGSIEVLGNQVAVVAPADVDASGTSGGGRILVGGDYQGANAAVQNSTNTFVGSGAKLRADATQSGDGGRIIVWSDDKAQFYGSLSAQGGAGGGNGGFAEVSGKQGLVFQGSASLTAPNGAIGNLLLDPLDMYVFAGGGLDPTILAEPTPFPNNAATVSPATLAAIGASVTLQASRYMRITDAINLTTAGAGLSATVGTYTLPAAPDPLSLATNSQINNIPNQLEIRAGITTAGGAVSLTAPVIRGPVASTIATSGGAVSLTSTTGEIQGFSLALDAGSGAVNATAATLLQLGALTGGSVAATAQSSLQVGAINSGSGAVSLTSASSGIFGSSVTTTGGSFSATAPFGVFVGTLATAGGNVSLTSASSQIQTSSITTGAGNVSLSGTSISAGAISNTGMVGLTATNGNIFASAVDSASSLTANATTTSPGASAQVFINGSATVLNATNVTATAGSCSSPSFCPSATVQLNASGLVNVGTVSASAPATTATSLLGPAYTDAKFENRSESVAIFSSGGSIRAMSGTSLITALDVSLGTGLQSGGGIGKLTGTPLPVRIDVDRALTLNPNGEFNIQLTGGAPNRLGMQVGVAPLSQSYTGSLSGTGLTLGVSATDAGVTATTFNIASGFNQRVFNGSPEIEFRVPNGNLTAPTVNVPAGDQTGTAAPAGRFNCDTFGGAFCPAPVTIEPLAVTLSASGNLSVGTYTRAASAVAKSTTFHSDTGSVTLGTVNASRDPVTITAQGNVTITSLDTSAGPGNVFISTLGTVGAGSDSAALDIQAGTANVTIEAGTVGAVANAFPLDIAAGSVSLTSASGGIGFTGKPVRAITQDLTLDAASTFNVSTSTVNLRDLTVTANPAGVGVSGLADVTSNGTNYHFASDGTDFALGGASFPVTVPAAQFAGGTLSFTSTSGNLTLNALNFSASSGNFSATTNATAGTITQTAGQPINLGSGTLTLRANDAVTLESVNAGGLTATNATIDGCATVGGVANTCGVASLTANQTLTDTANAGGFWTVNSRGPISTQALQVGGVDFTAASGDITTGAIGTAARPVTAASLVTNGTTAGGNIQVNGAIEADDLTLAARGSVIVGTGSLPADVATGLINAVNTDAASISLSSQTGSVIVNGVMNASDIAVSAATSMHAGNVNSGAATPGSVVFTDASGSATTTTGSLDGTSIVVNSSCFFCRPGNIDVGTIGAGATKPTNLSMVTNGSSSIFINGTVTMDSTAPGNLFLDAGTTLTGNGPLGALAAVTAGDGSTMFLRAGSTAVAPLFQFTQINAGATGSVTIHAPAGIFQVSGVGNGITAQTVELSATNAGATIGTFAGFAPAVPIALSGTSDLTVIAGGPMNINRTGSVPLLTNVDITRGDQAANVGLAGFAAGNSISIANVVGGSSISVVNTSATPLDFAYRNNDGTNSLVSVTGPGIATKGGAVELRTVGGTGTLATGSINTKSGSATPDGSINLSASQLVHVSGTVDSGGGTISVDANSISAGGSLVSTNNVFVQASAGNIGGGPSLAISSPSATLRAFGATPGTTGNVFATLTGTTELSVTANDGFVISSSVALTDFSLNTQGAGTAPLTLTTTGAQSFGLARNGTNVDVTSVTSTPALGSFGLTVNGGGITVKGGIAADTLNLNASGVTTLDGSTSALTLSNVNQSISGSAGISILGDVMANATSSQSLFTGTNLTFTGKGTLSAGSSQAFSASGNLAFTSAGGGITLTSGNTQTMTAFGNIDFTATGGPISAAAANQTIQASGGSSILTLQGGTAAGQSVVFTASTSQAIQASDTPTSFIRLLAGTGADTAAKIVYTGTGTQFVQGGNVVLAGSTAATGTNASALITTATGAQRVRANTDIILTGGAASGAVAKIENTSANPQRVGESEFIPFCCSEPYQTDNVIVQGGTAAEAAIVAAGLQKIQASNGVRVLAGSGTNGDARIETTAAGVEQRIGCNNTFPAFESCSNTLQTLDVVAGPGGATAQILNAGIQRLRGNSNLTMTGHANAGGFARIATTGTVQSVQFFGTDVLTAGTGAGSDVAILSAGTQESFQFGNLSLIAGGPNSVAKIGAVGDQSISVSGNLTLTAKGDHVTQVANASALIEGQNQFISASGTIALNGGGGVTGSTSDALLRNTAGSQFVSGGNIQMNGGHTFSTTGILNQGTGTQSVSANSGFGTITMVSDPLMPPGHVDSFVLIQNTPSTDQNINGALSLTNSGAGTVAVLTPARQTIVAFNGGVSINSQGTDAASVTKIAAGGDQLIRSQFVDVQTDTGSVGSASLEAAGNQWIHTTSGTSSPSGNSMRIAALGTGTARIEAGASQLIELDYPEQMQGGGGGGLHVGDSLAAGISRLKAIDQNIFARSITVETGRDNTLSEIKASGTQIISVMNGNVEVLGGSGNNSLAQIDPVTQTILVNGSVNVLGGDGINAVAQIVNGTGTQTILATNGDVTAVGGISPGADAIISSIGPQSVAAAPPGTVTPTPTSGGGNAIIGGGASPTSPVTAVIAGEFGTAPVVVVDEQLDQTLTEVAPEGIGQDPIDTRRAPICR